MTFRKRISMVSLTNSRIFLSSHKFDLFYYKRQCFSIQIERPTTKAQITQAIAKKFRKVSLQKFPLVYDEDFDMKKFRKLAKINKECMDECLDSKPASYPSISSILNQTMPPESVAALKKWETNKIKELGFEGFQQYKKQIFSRGKTLHTNIENYLRTRDESVLKFPNQIQENIWKSIQHVLPDIDVLYGTEFPVYHPYLRFQGIIDCVASYHNVPTLFEWKSSEKLKPTVASTYDNSLQAVGYFSCLQFTSILNQNLKTDGSNSLQSRNIKEVILVIGYENGSPANVHLLEHNHRERIWQLFLKRLESFWMMTADK